jgi:DNA mismatch repair protein MutS
VLVTLESWSDGRGRLPMGGGRRRRISPPPEQLPLVAAKPPLLEELADLDVDSLTPLEAITKLYELREKAREG